MIDFGLCEKSTRESNQSIDAFSSSNGLSMSGESDE